MSSCVLVQITLSDRLMISLFPFGFYSFYIQFVLFAPLKKFASAQLIYFVFVHQK